MIIQQAIAKIKSKILLELKLSEIRKQGKPIISQTIGDPGNSESTFLAMKSDKYLLFANSSANTIKIYKYSNKLKLHKTIEVESTSNPGSITSLAYIPQADLIAIGFDYTPAIQSLLANIPMAKKITGDKTVSVIKLLSMDGQQQIELSGHSDCITSITPLSQFGDFASASKDYTIKLWDKTGKCLQTIIDADSETSYLAVLPAKKDVHNERLVSGNSDGTVKIWDLENGKCIKVLYRHNQSVNSLLTTPQGDKIISASDDGQIIICETKSWTIENILQDYEEPITSIALYKNGTDYMLVSGDKGIINVWSLENSRCVRFAEHGNAIASSLLIPPLATINPLQRLQTWQLICGNSDNTVNLWSLPLDDVNLKEYKKILLELKKHPDCGIITLDLSNVQLDLECFGIVADILRTNETLQTLNLSNTNLDDAGALLLLNALQQRQPYITTITLINNSISPAIVKQLKEQTPYGAHIKNGSTNLQLKQYDAALREFDAARQLKPDATIHNNIAIVYLAQGNYVKAVEESSAALKLNRNCASAYKTRGIAYYHSHNYTSAIDDMKNAIRLNPAYGINDLETLQKTAEEVIKVESLNLWRTVKNQITNPGYQELVNKIINDALQPEAIWNDETRAYYYKFLNKHYEHFSSGIPGERKVDLSTKFNADGEEWLKVLIIIIAVIENRDILTSEHRLTNLQLAQEIEFILTHANFKAGYNNADSSMAFGQVLLCNDEYNHIVCLFTTIAHELMHRVIDKKQLLNYREGYITEGTMHEALADMAGYSLLEQLGKLPSPNNWWQELLWALKARKKEVMVFFTTREGRHTNARTLIYLRDKYFRKNKGWVELYDKFSNSPADLMALKHLVAHDIFKVFPDVEKPLANHPKPYYLRLITPNLWNDDFEQFAANVKSILVKETSYRLLSPEEKEKIDEILHDFHLRTKDLDKRPLTYHTQEEFKENIPLNWHTALAIGMESAIKHRDEISEKKISYEQIEHEIVKKTQENMDQLKTIATIFENYDIGNPICLRSKQILPYLCSIDNLLIALKAKSSATESTGIIINLCAGLLKHSADDRALQEKILTALLAKLDIPNEKVYEHTVDRLLLAKPFLTPEQQEKIDTMLKQKSEAPKPATCLSPCLFNSRQLENKQAKGIEIISIARQGNIFSIQLKNKNSMLPVDIYSGEAGGLRHNLAKMHKLTGKARNFLALFFTEYEAGLFETKQKYSWEYHLTECPMLGRTLEVDANISIIEVQHSAFSKENFAQSAPRLGEMLYKESILRTSTFADQLPLLQQLLQNIYKDCPDKKMRIPEYDLFLRLLPKSELKEAPTKVRVLFEALLRLYSYSQYENAFIRLNFSWQQYAAALQYLYDVNILQRDNISLRQKIGMGEDDQYSYFNSDLRLMSFLTKTGMHDSTKWLPDYLPTFLAETQLRLKQRKVFKSTETSLLEDKPSTIISEQLAPGQVTSAVQQKINLQQMMKQVSPEDSFSIATNKLTEIIKEAKKHTVTEAEGTIEQFEAKQILQAAGMALLDKLEKSIPSSLAVATGLMPQIGWKTTFEEDGEMMLEAILPTPPVAVHPDPNKEFDHTRVITSFPDAGANTDTSAEDAEQSPRQYRV